METDLSENGEGWKKIVINKILHNRKKEKQPFLAVYQQRFVQQLFLVFPVGECQSVVQAGGNFVYR